jgi:hypothetical protein
VVRAAVSRDGLAVERRDEVSLAQADEAETALADGRDVQPVAGTFVTVHVATWVIGWERLIPR